MKKFPFVIHFAINEPVKEVLIMAVWHEKRNPEGLKIRLGLE